jgi:two-component system OmpR family response regulator
LRLLLAEGDAPLAARLGARLQSAGFAVDLAPDTPAARAWPDLGRIGAIILDMALPDSEALLQGWTQRAADVPVLTLTARGKWQDKVATLNAGAADFVVKPVRFEELLARLHTLLRRREGLDGDWIGRDGLRLDTRGHKAELNGAPLALTRMEFNLLHLFLRHARQVLSQEDILDHLYEPADERQFNAVEVLISRLRRKIGTGRVETVRGLGYRLVA